VSEPASDHHIAVMSDFPIELWDDENVPREKLWELLREECAEIAARERCAIRAGGGQQMVIFRVTANPGEPEPFLIECDEGMAEFATLRLVVQVTPR